MKNNLVKELEEIQLIISSFPYRAWWYRKTFKVYEKELVVAAYTPLTPILMYRNSTRVAANYQKSLVVDFIIASWTSQCYLRVVVKGYPRLGSYEKVAILSDENIYVNCSTVRLHEKIPAAPHEVNPKPGAAVKTLRYIFDGVIVDASKFSKVEIFGYFYPFGLSMNKILPNMNGVKLELAAPDVPDIGDKIIGDSNPYTEALGKSYEYQRNHLAKKKSK